MKLIAPKPNDTLEVMIEKLNVLAQNIDQLKPPIFGLKPNSYIPMRSDDSSSNYFLYSQTQSIELAHKINTLTKNIQQKVDADSHNDRLIADAKRVLLQTYVAITNPKERTHMDLQRIANDVSGSPDIGAQVGIVLMSILLILLGILPGLLYIACKEQDWKNAQRKGLSLEADAMVKAIDKTNVLYGRFFNENRPVNETEESSIAAKNVATIDSTTSSPTAPDMEPPSYLPSH